VEIDFKNGNLRFQSAFLLVTGWNETMIDRKFGCI